MPKRTMTDEDALAAIHQAFDGEEWNGDTGMRVAEILTATGRQVRAPGDHERNDMYRIIATLRTLVDFAGKTSDLESDRQRLIQQVDTLREVWLAMSIENDDVPVLPLEDSPSDGPGCKRDARGRMYYSSEWNTEGT